MSGKKNNKLIFFIAPLILFLLINSPKVSAETAKDSDFDGLTDQSEVDVYHTDPNNADTDGDGILDYYEILNKTDPLDYGSPSTQNISVGKTPILKPGDPVMWYAGRIAGISAFIMFTFVVCFGLLMTSKILLKFPVFSAPGALETHSFTATFIAYALMVAHFTSLMFDSFIVLKLKEIFIPFILDRPNLKSALGLNLTIPVSLGVIAMYLATILVITSRLRRIVIPLKIWRPIHYGSFLFYVLFLVHGFLSGSDSEEPWMIAIYITSLTLVITLVLFRIFGKKYFLPKPKVPITVQPLVNE